MSTGGYRCYIDITGKPIKWSEKTLYSAILAMQKYARDNHGVIIQMEHIKFLRQSKRHNNSLIAWPVD